MTTTPRHRTSDHFIAVNAVHHRTVQVNVAHITMIDHDAEGRCVLTFSNGHDLYTNDTLQDIFSLMDEADEA